MDAAWSGRDEFAVGVVDCDAPESDHASAVATLVSGTDCPQGLECIRGNLETLQDADLDLLIAEGEGALSAVARSPLSRPVLPVGDVSGIETVAREYVPAVLPVVFDGGAREVTHPCFRLKSLTEMGPLSESNRHCST